MIFNLYSERTDGRMARRIGRRTRCIVARIVVCLLSLMVWQCPWSKLLNVISRTEHRVLHTQCTVLEHRELKGQRTWELAAER